MNPVPLPCLRFLLSLGLVPPPPPHPQYNGKDHLSVFLSNLFKIILQHILPGCKSIQVPPAKAFKH